MNTSCLHPGKWLGLVLLFVSYGASAGVSFDCIYDVTPLEYGANPTLYSQLELTDPQLHTFGYAISVSIVNTATNGADVNGPLTKNATKPVPPPASAWRIQNVFAWPPYSGLWALSSVARWTNIICVGGSCFDDEETDFCAAAGYVSASGGGGGGGGGCAIVAPQTSALSLSGAVQTLPVATRDAALVAQRAAEDGRPVVADAFSVAQTAGGLVLAIKHQAVHPDNANYTPTPRVQLLRRKASILRSLEGQRGFAIVEFGESGKVLDVQVRSASHANATEALRRLVATSARTTFQDQRRHDHTGYFAFEIRNGTIRQVGSPVVTLPMCCPGPVDPGEPCGNMHCDEN